MEKDNEFHLVNVVFKVLVVSGLHVTQDKVQAGNIIWKSSDQKENHGCGQVHQIQAKLHYLDSSSGLSYTYAAEITYKIDA